MTSISRVNFTSNEQKNTSEKTKSPKNEVVYVSKTPDAAVNAAGVVAGTAGMVGGAVLGGTMGVCKLPAGLASALAQTDYAGALKTSVDGFKAAVANSPELSNLVNVLKGADAPVIAEDLVHIVSTMTDRLNTTFAGDKEAKAVIDKVLDPIIKSITVKKNVRNYGSYFRTTIESPAGQAIMKGLGFNKKSSKVIGSLIGNIATGFGEAVENIKQFTPEEKQAWGRVAKQIKTELEHNPNIKTAGALSKAISKMCSSSDWIVNPFKNMQKTLADTISVLNKSLGNAPLKTIGKWSAIGAIGGTTVSTLGWLGLKSGLMKKETAKAKAAEEAQKTA